MGPTFNSPQACLAALPAFLNGKKVSADGRLYATDTTWYECDDEVGHLVQPQAQALPPKPYTFALCTTADQQCIQAIPRQYYETVLDCSIALMQMAERKPNGPNEPSFTLFIDPRLKQPNAANPELDWTRLYLQGKPHTAWLQCYDTRQ
jgi:hypothetical protein